MLSQQNRDELDSLGVTVVHDVISHTDCDRLQGDLRQWLSTFPEGSWPQTRNSLIQRYKAGHLQPAWEARVAARPVFAQVWGTDRLLTSMDAVAIGRPPEAGEETFWCDGDSWLHIDQTAEREGLHAYQGAVYLEECAPCDWTFEVIEGSNKYFELFTEKTGQWRCKNIKKHHVKWFEEKGCTRKRVPCPKGGMILWDSRTVHANARPVQGRQEPRWRFAVFVCMTPASWASPEDIATKVRAYEKMQLTTHWPSQGVRTFSDKVTNNSVADPNPDMVLPDIARTDDVRRLVGALPYDDFDEDGNDVTGKEPDFRPRWNRQKWEAAIEDDQSRHRGSRRRTRRK